MNFDAIFAMLSPILSFFSEKYGIVGQILAYGLFIAPIVSVIIEMIEFVVSFTASKSDDEFAAKLKAGWAKVMPILELLPHANIPLSPIMIKVVMYVMKSTSALKGAIQGWLKPPSQS